MSNPVVKQFQTQINHTCLLTWNELKKNSLAWLAPLPVLTGVFWWSSRQAWTPLSLNAAGTWAYLLTAIVLIMVYGLQAFSGEADRKTLDFILTKPLAPLAILFAKYLPGLIIFMIWWHSFSLFLKPDFASLNLPQGIGIEWAMLTFLTVHAVSVFSGLLSRGLERFFVITVMTAAMGSAAYYLWHKIFTLITVNFLWFDIPPQLRFFLEKLLPCYLAVLCLLLPLTGVYWSLKSKTRLWRFKPALGLSGAWLLTLLIIEFACFLFNPQVWPDRNCQTGDWHPKSGVVLAGVKKAAVDSTPQSYLSLNRNGRKPRIIHTGTDLKNPRFSPDGARIVFSENGRLKIMNLTDKTLLDIDEGEVAAWGGDGTSLIAAKKIGPRGLSRLYLIDLKNKQTRSLTSQQLEISDLVWDSERERLYLLSYTDRLSRMDLRDFSIKEVPFPEDDPPKFFGVVKPNLRLQKEDGLLFIGQVFDRIIKIYILNPENEVIQFSEEKSDFRILTNGPLLFNQEGTAYLWPRIDGGFVYQATYYDRDHHHHHDHHHDHDDHGHQHEHSESSES